MMYLSVLFLVLSVAFGKGRDCPSDLDLKPKRSCSVAEDHLANLHESNQSLCSELSFNIATKFDCQKVENNEFEPKKREFCVSGEQKEWAPPEKELMESIIRSMSANPKLRGVLLELASRGPINLYRSKTLAQVDPSGKVVANPAAYAFESAERGGMTITDFFFEEAKRWSQECRGFLFSSPQKEMERVLVHEIGHMYSRAKGNLERDCSFLIVTGWGAYGDRLPSIEPEELETLRKKGRDLLSQKNYDQAAKWTMSQAQKKGFPTLYAMVNPDESFAELFTFLALSDETREYIRPEVAKWFDEQVFNNHAAAKPCPPKEM